MDVLRIGVIADTHDKTERMKIALEHLVAARVELIIHLGDFLNNYEPVPNNPAEAYSRQAELLVSAASKLHSPYSRDERTLILPGNHEVKLTGESPLGELEQFSMHKKQRVIGRWNFAGYGGGYKHVYDESKGWLAYTDARYHLEAQELEALKYLGVDVLLLHQLQHNGSDDRSLRGVVNKLNPKLVLLGHDHELGCESFNYGKSMIVKCGPVYPISPDNHLNHGRSSYAIIELGESIKVMQFYFGTNQHHKTNTPICALKTTLNLAEHWNMD